MAREHKNRSDFGIYLAGAIKSAGMSQYDFYTKAEITKPYFYDIMAGKTNPPPRETLERMLDVLNLYLPEDPARRNTLFDLAAKCRQEIPVDITDLIKEHPEQWNDIRKMLNDMLIVKSEETDDGEPVKNQA